MQSKSGYPHDRYPTKGRSVSSALVALAAAMMLGSAAHAATYTGQVTVSPDFNLTNPGFQINDLILSNAGPQAFVSTSFSFDLLNIGDSFNTDIFVLRTLQTTATFPDDGIQSPFGINFTFGGGLGTATVTGTTFAQSSGGSTFGVMDVSGPAIIDVGGGRAIRFDIADATFNAGVTPAFTPGKVAGATVSYTASLVTAVPEPGTWAMMLAGLAGIGFVARRQRSTTASPSLT